jgi:methylenetetrahydrofolate dehydrogenase (NADP+)/methenyltetrahydrofolate cyclohydrolase
MVCVEGILPSCDAGILPAFHAQAEGGTPSGLADGTAATRSHEVLNGNWYRDKSQIAHGKVMTAQIIDGKQVAAGIRAELKDEVAKLKGRGVTPGLGVILVGDDPASVSYVTGKERACDEVGIYSDHNHLPAGTSQEELLALVRRMNGDPKINGILVQLPLPRHISESEVLLAIDPEKDVDGFHPVNVGKMVVGEKAFLPCTPHGVVQLLLRSGVTIDGAHVVIVGRSNIVGKPLANILIQKSRMGNATVTVCHTRTKDLARHTRQADILIAAAGRPNTITTDMVKDGVVVIDVGVNRVEDATKQKGYRLVGDVDFEAVREKASLITPVPGGVGPMTITMLLYNTVESAKLAAR